MFVSDGAPYNDFGTSAFISSAALAIVVGVDWVDFNSTNAAYLFRKPIQRWPGSGRKWEFFW
jgi:hypothetical protein